MVGFQTFIFRSFSAPCLRVRGFVGLLVMVAVLAVVVVAVVVAVVVVEARAVYCLGTECASAVVRKFARQLTKLKIAMT